MRYLGQPLDLLFGYPFITPSVDEYGMFHAHSVSLRSSDLSRQVGAVITSNEGEFIAAGCNEVPKAGGGSVWDSSKEAESKDYRDFKLGQDPSAKMKHDILAEVFKELGEAGWLSEEYKNKSMEKLVNESLYEGNSPPLKNTRAANIIEFGRIVHAEMSALTEASRKSVSVKDSTLYCTTYPCHMCARHIISAGIKTVTFIEPYPKSLAKDLYKKMIKVDGGEADDNAVDFKPFVGIAPRKYFDLFEMVKRKDEKGFAISWNAADASPRLNQEKPAYFDYERMLIDFLRKNAVDYGLIGESDSDSK